ncbi:MAG: tetratricopeptide repeat protein [Myxococcales bacterium]|nr:tetratricopeptide repeat protein [Myxococcales bacterium]
MARAPVALAAGRRRGRPTLVLAAALGAALAAGTLGLAGTPDACAAPPTPQQKYEALTLSREAEALLKKGAYADAAKKLERADALDPAPEYKVALAQVLIELKDFVRAGELLAAAATAKPATIVQKKAVDRAKEFRIEVEERTPTLAVEVREPAANAVVLQLDGEPFEADTASPVNPGHHELTATAPGYQQLSQGLDLKESDRKTLPVTLVKSGSASAEDAGASSRGFNKLPAVIAWGVGGAALFGMGVGAGVYAMDATQEVSDVYRCGEDGVCHPTPEQRPYFDDDLYNAQVYGNLSTAGFVLAGVGAAAGAVLWVLSDRSQAPDEPPSARLVPLVAPGFAGVAGSF